MDTPTALLVARRTMDLGRVLRATRHPDGTPESDTTHTVMLSAIACEFACESNDRAFAQQHSKRPHFDVGLVAQFATVHDYVEALCGDVNTFDLGDEARAAKDKAEALALGRLVREHGPRSWLVTTLLRYEQLDTPEAQLVYVLDKTVPKVTHCLNGAATLRAMGKTPDDFVRFCAEQDRKLAARCPLVWAYIHSLRAELVDATLANWGATPEED